MLYHWNELDLDDADHAESVFKEGTHGQLRLGKPTIAFNQSAALAHARGANFLIDHRNLKLMAANDGRPDALSRVLGLGGVGQIAKQTYAAKPGDYGIARNLTSFVCALAAAASHWPSALQRHTVRLAFGGSHTMVSNGANDHSSVSNGARQPRLQVAFSNRMN